MGNPRRVRNPTFLTGLLPPLLFCAVFYGCGTSMTVMPDVKNTCAAGFHAPGKIDYDGNRDYLPRILVADPVLQSPVVYRYLHAAEYGTQSVPDLLALFNPLTLVGFPTGGNMVRIVGKLDVVVDNLVVRSYSAGAALDKTRSLYAGETYTDLRKMGLIAVRDNIEAQLCRDAEFLAGISNRAPHDNLTGGAPKETIARIGEEKGAGVEGPRPAKVIQDDAHSAKTTEPGNTAPAVEEKTVENANASAPLAVSSDIVRNPEEIADYLRMGNKLYEEGDYVRAIGVYKRILNVYAGNKEASDGLLRAEKARAAAEHVPGR